MCDELDASFVALRRFQISREAKRRAARLWPDGKFKPEAPRNRLIAEVALVREEIPGSAGAEFWVTHTSGREEFLRLREDPKLANIANGFLDPDALNGYVAFPKRHAPRLPKSDANIVQYIPVHGGVSYARKDAFAAVWGFDTMHAGSENEPRTDQDWIRANCWILYRGLILAARLWPEFRRAGQPRRIELADRLLALVEEQPLIDKLGFGAQLNMLITGRVG